MPGLMFEMQLIGMNPDLRLGTRFTKEVIEFSKKISRDIVEYKFYMQDVQYIQIESISILDIFLQKNLLIKFL